MSNLRGMHSTGIIMGNRSGKKQKGNKISWNKTLGPSIPMLFGGKLNDKTNHNSRPFLMAGHTRYATIGEVDLKNAHPFHKGTIVGMHNGTANSYKEFLSKKTDSENIINTINREGLEKTLSKFNYSDAFALVWVDMKENRLMFIRNHLRSLYLMRNRALNTVMWASEKEMLDFASARSDLQFNDPLPVSTGVLYSFDLNDPSNFVKVNMDEYMPKKPEVITPTKSYPNYGGEWYDNEELWSKGDEKKATSVPAPIPKKLESTFIKTRKCVHNQVDMVEVADGLFLACDEIEDIIMGGCGICDSVPLGEAEKIIAGKNSDVRWFSSSEYLCRNCATPDTLELFPCMEQPKSKEM